MSFLGRKSGDPDFHKKVLQGHAAQVRSKKLDEFRSEVMGSVTTEQDRGVLLGGLEAGTPDLDAQISERRKKLEVFSGLNIGAKTEREELAKRPGRRATILTRNQPLLG